MTLTGLPELIEKSKSVRDGLVDVQAEISKTVKPSNQDFLINHQTKLVNSQQKIKLELENYAKNGVRAAQLELRRIKEKGKNLEL